MYVAVWQLVVGVTVLVVLVSCMNAATPELGGRKIPPPTPKPSSLFHDELVKWRNQAKDTQTGTYNDAARVTRALMVRSMLIAQADAMEKFLTEQEDNVLFVDVAALRYHIDLARKKLGIAEAIRNGDSPPAIAIAVHSAAESLLRADQYFPPAYPVERAS